MVGNINLNDMIDVISVASLSRVLLSIILVILLVLVKKLIHQIIRKQVKSNKTIYKWKRTTNSFLTIIGIIMLAVLWFSSFGSFTAFLGFITAAIAFALRDIVKDLAGYIFVVVRKPFQVSDRIELGNIKGDVLQIEWFQVTLLEVGNWVSHDQSTGRIIYMPLNQVLTQPIHNYTAGFDWIWNEIGVLLTFESNWQKAKAVILDIITQQDIEMNEQVEKKLKKAMQHHLIEYSNTKPIVYTNTTDSGINLTVRYLCPPKKRRYSEHQFWEAILHIIDKDKTISLAYPTVRHINSP